MGAYQILLDILDLRHEARSDKRTAEIILIAILAYKLEKEGVALEIIVHELNKHVSVLLDHVDEVNDPVLREIEERGVQVVVAGLPGELGRQEAVVAVHLELPAGQRAPTGLRTRVVLHQLPRVR